MKSKRSKAYKGKVKLTLYPEVTKTRLRAYLKARKWPKKEIDAAIKELWDFEIVL